MLGPAILPLPEGVRDLSRGNPDHRLLPDLGAALARCPQPVGLYGEAPEPPALVAHARAALRGDGVPAELPCVVSGALDGIERALASGLRPRDHLAVDSPDHAPRFAQLRAQALAQDPVCVDAPGRVPQRLASAPAPGAQAVVATPRGQNAT